MVVNIDIAGTSHGGSSYATRILKVIAVNPTGTQIQINIGKGVEQNKVYDTVVKAARLIEASASKLSNMECSFNFRVTKV